MCELDTVRELAKEVLIISTATNKLCSFLWDRAERLARNVEYICRLPELSKAGPQIDHFCLITATYFSDAGLAYHLRGEEGKTESAFPNSSSDNLPELCTLITEEKLSPYIDKTKIKNINRIITESNNRTTKMLEAMILSDARNLDDTGLMGIFNEFRRLISNGKGPRDALQSWKKKIDYRYWQARLREDFRFESVRKLAEHRLTTAEHFMNQFKVEINAQDIEKLIIELLENIDTSTC